MRFPILQAIYQKEMLDILRDRRTLISMVVVPLLVFPAVITVFTRVASRVQHDAEQEARTMGIAARVTTPAIREALEKTGYRITEKDDLKSAVEKNEVAAAVEETGGATPAIRIYVDSSSPASNAAGDNLRLAFNDLRDQEIRENLRQAGIAESVLTPFTVHRTNVAGQRKMAGAMWGTMLGYILLLLMFTGGMYAVIDMTAGEKERKTLEAFLASPAARHEIVMGKILAAMTAILITAALMLGSLVYSLKNNTGLSRSPEMRQVMGTIPLDSQTLEMIAATVVPVAIFAASLMFAIALFARSFKEGQSYLTPLALAVIFPALLGGLPGLHFTWPMCLIPIFNASMVIRGTLLGDLTPLNFILTMAANLVYAAIAFVVATMQFEKESVLFRS
ncbi:MAG TPA: ABC transporter permease subunit [Bryobacteraceae bacterium]|nr:ABC transporter permease subunit [Bryobacteraceae bacterium]